VDDRQHRVQLGDVTDTFAQIAVVAPQAAQEIAGVVTGLSPDRLRDLAEHGNVRAPWDGGTAIVARVTDTGEPGYDLYVERAQAGALKTALGAVDVVEADEPVAEAIRIESGVPLFRRDMGEIRSRRGSMESRHQLHAGLLRRAGGRDPRAAPRVRTRGAQAGGLLIDGRRCRHRCRDSQRRSRGRLATSRRVAGAEAADCAGHAPRFVELNQVTVGDQSAEVTTLPFVGPTLKSNHENTKKNSFS
jgi:hypothetical protein